MLWLGDCRDVLPRLDRASVGLILTDPPYGVMWAGTSGRTRLDFGLITGDDGTFDPVLMLQLALPALMVHRHVYVFGLEDFGGLPLASAVDLIWDKGILGTGNTASPWGPSHERILFGMYVPSKANRADGKGQLAARLRRGSVLRADRANGVSVTQHPTEKPVSILRQMIESSTLFGDVVLDPCAGSGSTLVAAKLEGRRSIGIEIDERYCATAARRLSQQRLPLEMGTEQE